MKTKRQKIRKGLLLISFCFFPAIFFYFSPYLIVDGTINQIITGSFIAFSLQFLSSLFLGRAFCGWVCAAGGAQEAFITVRNKRVTKGNFVKWIIWTPWIIAIIAIAVKNGGYKEINPFYRTQYGLSISNVYALITYLIVLSLIVIPTLIFGRRSFCHHICWMAPFMIIGRKIRNIFGTPALQLSCSPEKCVKCHSCTKNCPMSLEVEQNVIENKLENTECILCTVCVDSCPKKAIGIEFAAAKKTPDK